MARFETGWSADQLDQPVHDLLQFLRTHGGDAFPETIYGYGPQL